MRFKASHFLLFILVGIVCFSASCKKDQLLTAGGELKFSTDTLAFDTVFTAVGSFTAAITISNPQSQDVIVSSVHMQNANSYFHLNVDGNLNSGTNIKIRAHDSIYVFATVNIDPSDSNTPFFITDNLVATMNGKTFSLPFTAYGQNAYYVVDSVFKRTNVTWRNDKPYVIVHSAEIDTDAVINIPAGCHIYMNGDSRLLVHYNGSLRAIGTATDTIVFKGDRLDRAYYGYVDYPGEWGGIYFDSYSSGNILDYVKLENCGNTSLGALPAAIQVSPDSTGSSDYQLVMKHTIIQNSIGYGLLCFAAHVHAENCLIHTCGAQTLALVQGGNYTIDDCTFTGYSTANVSHLDAPTAAILNYYQVDETHYIPGALTAKLTNCLIWGSLSTELVCDKVNDVSANVTLDHCLYKADSTEGFVNAINCIVNNDPLFKDYTKFDFHLDAGSPAINAGTSNTSVPITDDLEGNVRSQYDIGCYKYQ